MNNICAYSGGEKKEFFQWEVMVQDLAKTFSEEGCKEKLWYLSPLIVFFIDVRFALPLQGSPYALTLLKSS